MLSPWLTLVAEAYPLICPVASSPAFDQNQPLEPGCWFSKTLVLQDNWIVGGELRARRGHPSEQAEQGRHHDPSQPHRCRSFAAGTVGALPSTMWRSWSWTPHSPMAASPWYQKPAAAALIGETRSWPSKMRSPLSLVKV